MTKEIISNSKPFKELLDNESPFEVHELFFSTTDKKGIITSGNEVFRRVSEYQLEELLGKPHSIIRHPDMPRSVFKLLWDYLEAGKSIVAYVKNRSKSGKHYWVLAYVKPIPSGYLSIRLKPVSPLRAQVEGLYSQMLAIEQEHGDRGNARKTGMANAAELLVQTINALGFENYDRFMQHALETELACRSEIISKGGDSSSSNVQKSVSIRGDENDSIETLLSHSIDADLALGGIFSRLSILKQANSAFGRVSDFIADLSNTMRLLALNASVEAGKLGEQGRAVATLSAFLGRGSKRMLLEVGLLSKAIGELMPQVYALMTEIASAKLQIEMLKVFLSEIVAGGAIATSDLESQFKFQSTKSRVNNLLQAFSGNAVYVTEQLSFVKSRFNEICLLVENVTRCSKEVSFVHVSGKVEAARLPPGCSFGMILKSINEKILMAEEELSKFMKCCNDVVSSLHSCGEGTRVVGDYVGVANEFQSHTSKEAVALGQGENLVMTSQLTEQFVGN